MPWGGATVLSGLPCNGPTGCGSGKRHGAQYGRGMQGSGLCFAGYGASLLDILEHVAREACREAGCALLGMGSLLDIWCMKMILDSDIGWRV